MLMGLLSSSTNSKTTCTRDLLRGWSGCLLNSLPRRVLLSHSMSHLMTACGNSMLINRSISFDDVDGKPKKSNVCRTLQAKMTCQLSSCGSPTPKAALAYSAFTPRGGFQLQGAIWPKMPYSAVPSRTTRTIGVHLNHLLAAGT